MKRLLITGGSGLLGSHVTSLVKEKGSYEVFSVSSKDYNLLSSDDRIRLIKDIKPEYLVHLAWNQSAGFRNADNNEDWAESALDLMQTFRENGGKRFLFAGSSSEYDAENGTFSENEGSAKSKYGKAKRKVSEAVSMCGFGISARYFTIFGKDNRHPYAAIPSVITSLLHNENVICRSPETIRDYIYVDDAAKATVKLLDSSLTGIINIASGNAITMRKVFDLIGHSMGKQDLIDYGNEPGEFLSADISRMKNELCYNCKMTFEEAIKETIAERKLQLGL